ncbi:MAG: diaminopimelate decarboxylase [Methanomassiliicoccales archaeon]|jgi:diaminopimelate decarboxylase
MRDFKNDKGQMIIGGVKATDIAAGFGSPVYVTDEDALRGNFRRINTAFQKNMPTRIHYACKANTNLSLLRILQQEGSSIDAVSVGEVRLCLKAGFTPDRILYTGVMVSDKEMQQIVDLGVPINVDSINQLRRLAGMNNKHPISFRVNPGVGAGHHQHVVTGAKTTKFGVPKEQILDTYQEALSLGFKPFGIHAHIGAGVQETAPFLQVTEVLVDIANSIRDHLGFALDVIDIGGGIGIPYHLEENHMDVDALSSVVSNYIKRNCYVRKLAIEPGRYLVADTTVLLTTVGDIKEHPEKTFAGVDAGFNTLIRPAFYGSYHHVAVANKFGARPTYNYDIVGPICESGDFIARDRMLPRIEIGDLIAVYDAGAYGFTMASNYNSRPLPAEVLVKDGQINLIREAQTLDDLTAHQRIPARLMV